MFSQGPPPKTSSYPKPDLNICVGFAELFSQTFFSSCREKVTWGLDPHPLTKMSQLSPKERDSCWVCALLIGAEFMVKSEAPPRKLCQPWSTGSLKISTQENYTLKHIHAFVFFFFLLLLLWWPGESNSEINLHARQAKQPRADL